MASLGKCHRCSKTCYQNEGHRVGPPGKEIVFHKLCMKCQNEGCGWQLTITSYIYCDGKIWCKNHEPMRGFSNTAHQKGNVTTDAVSVEKALNAPKLSTVNEQIRTSNTTNTQVADMATANAMNAPKLNVVNEQIKPGGRNAQNFL